MSYKILGISNLHEWKSFFEQLPFEKRDIYYTPEYYSLCENTEGGETCCFIFEIDNKIGLYPFIKNPIKLLGYDLDKEYYDIQGAYGYNGIISSTDDPAFIESFWKSFDSYCKENDIIAEFTRFHPLLNNQRIASPKMQTLCSRYTVALDLTDDDIWMHQISSKNRNMIRKAEKEGVIIVESDDYETFRRLYDGTMTDLHADSFYFFPKSYYDEFKLRFKNNSMLCFAMLNERVIAGSLFMFSDDYAHYHLSGRDREYSRYAANNLILWYAIQKAKERGCKWFHFGGGTTGNDDDSLLKFKKEFSKTLCEFWIGKRIHNQVVYDQIVDQWKSNHPNSYTMNKVRLLGYRDI